MGGIRAHVKNYNNTVSSSIAAQSDGPFLWVAGRCRWIDRQSPSVQPSASRRAERSGLRQRGASCALRVFGQARARYGLLVPRRSPGQKASPAVAGAVELREQGNTWATIYAKVFPAFLDGTTTGCVPSRSKKVTVQASPYIVGTATQKTATELEAEAARRLAPDPIQCLPAAALRAAAGVSHGLNQDRAGKPFQRPVRSIQSLG